MVMNVRDVGIERALVIGKRHRPGVSASALMEAAVIAGGATSGCSC
jgi:hypothetical protein